MDRFQRRSGGGGGFSRSLRREKSPHRSPPSSSKAATPDIRPRGSVFGDLLLPSDRACGEGNIEIRKAASNLKMESDGRIKIPTQHNMRCSPKKASGIPIKILMDEEMQKPVESRRHSPSVIAKLMGLDPLPARQPCNSQKKESVVCSRKKSSEDYLEKCMSHEERTQEFKDIFEVQETKSVEKPNPHAPKGLPSSRQKDKDMAIIWQKFMDAKHLSTDEKLQYSEEFSEALEIIDSNKDLFLNFLEEPTSLFKKHLRDLRSVPATPEATRITILKSFNVSKNKSSEICQKLGKKTERSTPTGRNAVHKPESDILMRYLEDHTIPLSRNLAKSKLEGNTDASSLPTRIVVLKPGLETVQKATKIQGSSETFHSGNFGYGGYRASRRSRSLELFSELRERHKLPDDGEVTHRIKDSREIAKEITRHMRQTVNGDRVKSYDQKHGVFPENNNLHRMPISSAHIDFAAARQISDHVDGSNNCYRSSYLTGTYSSREARKQLSERWLMSHKFQEVGLAGRGWSTLGEMLALSDRETPDVHSGSLYCQEGSFVKFSGKDVGARCSSPSGISSSDGWKDGCSSGLPRSKSLPASSRIHGSPSSTYIHGSNIDNPFMLKDILNIGSREVSVKKSFNQRSLSPCRDVKVCSSMTTSQPSDCDGEENKLPVCEIHVDQDEPMNAFDSKNSPAESFVPSEISASNIPITTCLLDSMSFSCDASLELACPSPGQQPMQSLRSSVPASGECSPPNYANEAVAKEASCGQPEVEAHPYHTCVNGQTIADTAEQPSPISVLEPPDENECSSETFERVSADLQELRMQLQLLKLESRDTSVDRLVINGEDSGREDPDVSMLQSVPQTSGVEEDGDLSYLLNVLKDSGFHSADWNILFSGFYSPESPVCPDVFEKIEKNYSGFTWSRAERKLLFDAANSVLADVLALNMDPHPWVKPRRVGFIGCKKSLTEEVCHSVRRNTDMIGDASGRFMDGTRWLDLAEDTDSMGREIERMLKDDILDELISEIVSVDRGRSKLNYPSPKVIEQQLNTGS